MALHREGTAPEGLFPNPLTGFLFFFHQRSKKEKKEKKKKKQPPKTSETI